ncbi:hypothetical protein BDN72DRAFT_65728 [Pluteus cervinus]|uniref:Uncharacterized protein n=1 Tax=Pluteus cervinus TaxID=181527 RepID=A0ACD2ZZK7_9AGAR|nr:hypothetical protein BDN72DRAFT_65728 [Pluteus cervinus]
MSTHSLLDFVLGTDTVLSALNTHLQSTKLKIPVHPRRSFAIDLAFIANSIRTVTSYLFDTFAVQNATSFLSSLLQILRQHAFEQRDHVFEPTSSLSFINKSNLLETLSTILNLDHDGKIAQSPSSSNSSTVIDVPVPKNCAGAYTEDGSPIFVRPSSASESMFENPTMKIYWCQYPYQN